jgi:hypothetical protein
MQLAIFLLLLLLVLVLVLEALPASFWPPDY